MHPIYTTQGFIIDSRPRGEAGKLISIFTRDFGLIVASAQGIRLEKSKLRYHAQDHSFGTFSLVRGWEFWRLTSAQGSRITGSSESEAHGKSDDPASDFPSFAYGSGLIVRLALLLRRLLHGEEAHPELFDLVQSCRRFIEENPGLDDERSQTLESLVVIRILSELGYVGDVTDFGAHVRSVELSIGSLDSLKGKRMAMNMHINKALKASQL